MTVTYNSAADQLWVVADFIQDIINGDTGFTLDLAVTINGGTAIAFETIVIGDIDVPNTRFEIAPADLSLTTFDNGIYSFKFTKTTTATGSKAFDSYCLFVDVDYTCDVVDNIAASVTDQDKVIYTLGIFNILKNIHSCEECNCTNALTLWNEINYELELETRDNDCGCN